MSRTAVRRMPNQQTLVFSGLHLPRPLSLDTVVGFLVRLASDRDMSRIALEVRADQDGVRHLLGTRATDNVHALRRMLGDLIPGSVLMTPHLGTNEARIAVQEAGSLRIHPPGLPLRSDTVEASTAALFSALAAPLRAGETIVIQIVLGPRLAPRRVPPSMPDPSATLADALTHGSRPADAETRQRVKERLSQAGFAATIRLGATSPDTDRRRRFISGMLSALLTLRSPGVRIELIRERPRLLNQVRLPWRWPLSLGVSELAGLLAWPIGKGNLPGLPPLHPRPLRAAPNVHTGPRVFAQSAAPGDDRTIGISETDQMFHAVAYGPSGSGKTNALLHLIVADIEAGRPVVVLDPKRQLIDDVLARMPDHRVKDVVEINAADPNPIGFNPLDVAGRDPDVVVDGILAVFQAVFADGWGPRTADIFSASLRTLARASSAGHPATLVDLPRLLTDPQFRRPLVGRVQSDMALAGFWASYEAQSPGAQAAVIAPPLNKLRQFLLRPALTRILDQGESRFRLRDTFRNNKVVLVPLNDGLVGPGTAALLGSLVIADLWQATQERAEDPTASTRPAMIYIDEAPRFLNLPLSLADALAVSRSLGVGWFLAAQLRSQFPADLRTAVDMNARSKLQFATEHDDARDSAKLAPTLTAEDFIALPRYHAYVNVVADGHPSGWALVKTLPPRPATADPDAVRAAVRARYAPEPVAEPDEPAPAKQGQVAPAPVPVRTPHEPIGRKRRRR
jgi:hypothetical protein